MKHLQSSDPAPAFSAVDQTGKTVSLGDFKGRKCFIFFYPKANTAG
jgi:peroxiredoxin Q/BCP